MPTDTLRLKDIDPSEFAAQVSQAVIDTTTRTEGIVFCRKQWGGRKGKEALTNLYRLAKCVAMLARDREWHHKGVTCDVGLVMVASIVTRQTLADFPGDSQWERMGHFFAYLYADAPLTGKCDDLVKFTLSCAAMVVAIERMEPPPPECAVDLTSWTADEANALIDAGHEEQVLAHSKLSPTAGDA